jgi:Raf kinase inhibitor-like YbhB/YbcL family protein
MNSWGRNDWGGPCPPDKQHRYFFKLFALDTTLDLPAAAGKPALLAAMQGHIIAKAELVGVYDRRSRRQA